MYSLSNFARVLGIKLKLYNLDLVPTSVPNVYRVRDITIKVYEYQDTSYLDSMEQKEYPNKLFTWMDIPSSIRTILSWLEGTEETLPSIISFEPITRVTVPDEIKKLIPPGRSVMKINVDCNFSGCIVYDDTYKEFIINSLVFMKPHSTKFYTLVLRELVNFLKLKKLKYTYYLYWKPYPIIKAFKELGGFSFQENRNFLEKSDKLGNYLWFLKEDIPGTKFKKHTWYDSWLINGKYLQSIGVEDFTSLSKIPTTGVGYVNLGVKHEISRNKRSSSSKTRFR